MLLDFPCFRWTVHLPYFGFVTLESIKNLNFRWGFVLAELSEKNPKYPRVSRGEGDLEKNRTKGHLISKANCQAIVSPKKRTNEFVFTSMRRAFVRSII